MITNWSDLKIKHLIKIKDIDGLQKISEDEKNLMVAAILNDMEYSDLINMPLCDVQEIMLGTKFLYEKPKEVKIRKQYDVNGKKYKTIKDAIDITVAQYIDFQALEGEFDKHPSELLGIFLVPDGHSYNDGYDMDEVLEDMCEISVTEALGIANFFMKRYARLIRVVMAYLRIKIFWMKLTCKKEDRELMKALELETKLTTNQLKCMYGWIVYQL